jgi:hypothetical protein
MEHHTAASTALTLNKKTEVSNKQPAKDTGQRIKKIITGSVW